MKTKRSKKLLRLLELFHTDGRPLNFRVKDMDIATGGPLVAILNERDAALLDLKHGDRLILRKGKKEATCILDLSESRKAVPEGKIGLFEEVLRSLEVKGNDFVDLKFTGKPESVKHIQDKMRGKRLNYQELYDIIDDITHDRLTSIEKTYFVSAGFMNGWSLEEVVNMTRAMVETGEKLKFSSVTLDKHCIGGVPGNRTTMVVIPIVAAAGYTIPKTSSRAITSPAGTADTMECLAKVELSYPQIKKVVKKTGACIVHGGSMNLAPADDKIIEVEHPLSIDADGQLLASVMAKKYSVTAKYVLIDIPTGKSTKARTPARAQHLKKMFEKLGRKLRMHVKVVITDGSQPVGRGVGPLLEAEDVLSVLKNDPRAPPDLKKKSIFLAGTLLSMAKKCSGERGIKMAKEILEKGQAYEKMQEIIQAQGVQKKPLLGTFKYAVRSTKKGRVREIDNEIISKIARVAGAPEDKGAGLLLDKKVGDKVKKGEVLYTIYTQSNFKLNLALEFLDGNLGYHVN